MSVFGVIKNMVDEAERHAESLSADRIRAVEYYRGEMRDTPSDEGRSKMVKRVVRAHVKKVLPSLARTLLGNDEIVDYPPVGEGDEEDSEQANDYINYVVIPESNAREAIYDALHDALLLRNGILKWWFDERQEVKVSTHTGLTDEAFGTLAGDDDVEVLEHTSTEEIIEEYPEPVVLHDVKIRRNKWTRCIKTAAVPRERFLIHPDAVTFEDSLLTGEKTEIRRSDLIAMGYERELVEGLALSDEDDAEESIRRDQAIEGDEDSWANEAVDYYDLYIRIDKDEDGISELRHMCFAGGLKERNLLLDEECDDVQMADIAVMRQPHQWEGISLYDDLRDLQQAETVLLRQTFDNLYWQNNPQMAVQEGAVVDMDALLAPEFGKHIGLKPGANVREAVQFLQVPFVAQQSFGMLEYLDAEAQDRTGVSDASAGLAPDALQNMTATGAAIIEQQGIGQTEFMVRTAAEGLRRFFRGLLRLSIKHADAPRTVRLRDEWVEFDPRHWNADMDVTVNTGLGAGTRERDMAVMQMVMGMQEKLLAGFGPDNPYVKPENVYNALAKLIEAAGLKSSGMYFTQPDPEEVKAKLEALKSQPNPEMMKIEGQMKLEEAKIAGAQAKEQAQMQADIEVERAQMDADLTVEQARIAAKERETADKLQADAALQGQKLAFDREKHADQMRLEYAKLGVQQRKEMFT